MASSGTQNISASSDRINVIDELDSTRKWSWSNLRHCHRRFLERLRKITITSTKMVRLRSGFYTYSGVSEIKGPFRNGFEIFGISV
jgi:hypothetical protein